MENSNRSNENTFVEFFKGLDENYQFYLINEMKKPPDRKEDSTRQTVPERKSGLVSR